MNREIKFRFIYGIDGEENTYFSKVFTFSEIENGCHWEWLCDNPLYRNYSILAKHQFTGLLDKHGNEIYEGDIVKYICESGGWKWDMVEPIKWLHGAYRFGNFGLGFNMPGITGNIKHHKYLEIIGNIYENPELLKEAT